MKKLLLNALAFLVLLVPISLESNADDDVANAEKKESKSKSLDDQLFDDLDSDLFEGLGDIPSKNSGDIKSQNDRQLADELKEGDDEGLSEEIDPLTQIGRRMQLVETLIARKNTSRQTQMLQQEIVEDLATLIELVQKQKSQKQSSSGSSSSAGKPNKPQQADANKPNNRPPRDSTQRLGATDESKTDAETLKQMLEEVWGHLPPRIRQQMQNASIEQFLPKYEKLIEEYFKRLAEERSNK